MYLVESKELGRIFINNYFRPSWSGVSVSVERRPVQGKVFSFFSLLVDTFTGPEFLVPFCKFYMKRKITGNFT